MLEVVECFVDLSARDQFPDVRVELAGVHQTDDLPELAPAGSAGAYHLLLPDRDLVRGNGRGQLELADGQRLTVRLEHGGLHDIAIL